VVWIFADVAYTAYLNSFFADTAALLGTMAAIPAGLLLASRKAPHLAALGIFGAGGLLLATSKSQHAPISLALAVLIAVVCWRTQRAAAIVVALALVAGSVWSLAVTPAWLVGEGRFNLIFFGILPASQNSARDAAELGIPPEDLKYIGMHSFVPNSPILDPVWMGQFSKTGYGGIAKFYLRHPSWAFKFLSQDLREQAWMLRFPAWGNYRRQDGHPPETITHRMSTWSDLQSLLLKRWPVLLPLWYALVLFATPVLAWRETRRFRAALLSVAWVAACMGLMEYGIATLCDVLETFRHLFLFHVLTDFTLFFALVWLADRLSYRARSTAG
jgi:hypothetical protein